MAIPARYILHQGPVLGALARAAFLSATGGAAGEGAAPELPGPVHSARIRPRPAALLRDYIRHVGGDPASYRGQLPAHLFPQWTFPYQARDLAGLPYPLQKVLNGGCRLELNAALPSSDAFGLELQLQDISDDGRRAVIHQSATMSTAEHPKAVVAHMYTIVPLGRGKGEPSEKKTSQRPHVPEEARPLGRWRIGTEAGLDFAKLTGDFNPIHWVPAAARAAGFRNVILHGYATLARAIEGLNRNLFAGDPGRLAFIDVKFTRPLVLPATVGLFVMDDQLFVGDAPGGPAYLVGTFSVRS
jgi:acyl dehydratase